MGLEESLKILYEEATQEEFTHSREEIEQARTDLECLILSYNHSKEPEEPIDSVEDARCQFFKDKPNFIKLGSQRIRLEEIKEYSICTNRELKILPDGTFGREDGFGLMIWLYNENVYHTIGCGTKEKAEKLQEKLDNILGTIDLGKEN